MLKPKDCVFHRDLNKQYPIITHGNGVYLYDEDDKRYIDACSGAIAVNLGHGVTEIIESMQSQAQKVAFVHSLRFETNVLHKLAKEIAELAPPSMNRVLFASGGSEANESAIKLAHQFHRDRGYPTKQIVIGHWQSYHGNTLGALSAGGDVKRRKVYSADLLPFIHIYSPFCKYCPYNQDYEYCKNNGMTCVDALERTILEIGAEAISAFICEPIVGSQQGAVVPPEGYFREVRKICDKYEIVLIMDEVMTGFGRTGKYFAVDHFGIEPDILTFGKGVSSGYAPLSGMIVHQKIIDSLIKYSDGRFIHGYTYSGHPVSVAAGLAAVRYYKEKRVIENCNKQSRYIVHKLEQLREKHPTIGEIRGKGLLIGVELLLDRERKLEFPSGFAASERLNQISMDLGAVFYPGSGGINGVRGQHLLIGPPLTIKEHQVDEMIEILNLALSKFEQELRERQLVIS